MNDDRYRSASRPLSGNPFHAQRSDALAPGFLLAPPPLSDPNFDRTLVLVAAHDAEAAMGFVLNRRAPARLHALLHELDVQPRVPDRDVLLGGPVSLTSGYVMYEHDAGRPVGPGTEITPTLSITPARTVLDIAARGGLPGRFELLLGHAGWGPGQLDDELARGAWLHAPFDLELVFDVPLDDRWDETWSRLGIDPSGFVAVRGGAQA
jgi:putative transcriptional regulator